MRPISKKNPPYDENIKSLFIKAAHNANYTGLRDFLATNDKLKAARKALINLVDNAKITHFIDVKALQTIYKQLGSDDYVKGFKAKFTDANFDHANTSIDNTITELNKLIPSPSDIVKALDNTATNNKIDITQDPNKVEQGAEEVITQIGRLILLKELQHFVTLRSKYTDATYNIAYSSKDKGNEHGDAKKHLISTTGLYCAFCESALTDGGTTDVEHKIPKGTFETFERKWDNFVLACKRCNSSYKSDNYVHIEGNIVKDKKEDTNGVLPLPIKASELDEGKNDVVNIINKADVRVPRGNAERNGKTLKKIIKNTEDAINADTAFKDARATKATETERRAEGIKAVLIEVNSVMDALRKDPPNDNETIFGYTPNGTIKAGDKDNADGKIQEYFDLTSIKNLNDFRETIANICIYNVTVKHAQNNTIWADVPYTNSKHIEPDKHITCFQAYDYALKQIKDDYVSDVIVGIANITLNSDMEVTSNGNTYQVNLNHLHDKLDQKDVRLKLIAGGKGIAAGILEAANGTEGVKTSAQNTIKIAGLNSISKEHEKDQVVIRRTKAWLNAMKQLRILKDFSTDIAGLLSYYGDHLHSGAIKNRISNNPIKTLQSPVPADIGFDSIKGTLTFPDNTFVPHNEVVNKVDYTGSIKSINNDINIDGKGDKSIKEITKSTLQGKIANNTFTGSLHIKTVTGAGDHDLTGKVISIWKAEITDQKAMTLAGDNTSVISLDVAIPELTDWENNRNKLVRVLDKSDGILINYIWENILNMVRDGGFYSTWVRTFQKVCSAADWTPPENLRFDIDLVRRLEIDAQSAPGDPFQFHGTDAAEVIQNLTTA